MDSEEQRIVELQHSVVSLRRQLPKAYAKLLQIENKHFHNNLQNGVCTIPAELQDISFRRSAEILDRCRLDIDALMPQQQQDDIATFAQIERLQERLQHLQTAQQMFQRVRRARS